MTKYKTETIAKITYNQYKRLKALSVDQIMDKHFLPVETAINIFKECKRIHSIAPKLPRLGLTEKLRL